MSRKIERLINLTIALLATKRYLTKSEIFRTVEGYEGSAETKERMFERDKDDLRTLGIEIEVGSFDPLFADEAGYRIHSEKYELNLGQITPLEISLLSLAAQSWEGAALAEDAQSAILKLNSIGVPAEAIDLPAISPKLSNSSDDLKVVTSAISQSDFLKFTYLGSDLTLSERTVIPFALSTKSGHWYISAVDQEIQEVRTFRLDRVQSSFELVKNSELFESPLANGTEALLETPAGGLAIIDVRKGKGYALRSSAVSTQDLGEWDQIKVPINGMDAMTSQILWHGEDVFVQEPKGLRDRVVAQLEELVRAHG